MIKAIQIPYNKDFEVKCRAASEAGFKHIGVGFSEKTDGEPTVWESAPETILEIFSRYDLKCVQTHLPFYDLMLSAEILDEFMECAITEAIKVSGAIGAKWCAYHPRNAVNFGYRSNKALELNRASISKYAECAAKANTGIAVENLPIFQEIIPVMPFYSCDYGDLCELADSFHSEHVGVCWDVGHANLMSFDQAEAIRYVGSRLKCTHIHNNFKDADWHLPPESGNIEWDKVMTAFSDIQYDGPFTLEVHCHYNSRSLLEAFSVYNYECLSYLEQCLKAGK